MRPARAALPNIVCLRKIVSYKRDNPDGRRDPTNESVRRVNTVDIAQLRSSRGQGEWCQICCCSARPVGRPFGSKRKDDCPVCLDNPRRSCSRTRRGQLRGRQQRTRAPIIKMSVKNNDRCTALERVPDDRRRTRSLIDFPHRSELDDCATVVAAEILISHDPYALSSRSLPATDVA